MPRISESATACDTIAILLNWIKQIIDILWNRPYKWKTDSKPNSHHNHWCTSYNSYLLFAGSHTCTIYMDSAVSKFKVNICDIV